MHADRCGLLVPLFDNARAVNASRHLQQLALLIHRYEEIRSLGYGGLVSYFNERPETFGQFGP